MKHFDPVDAAKAKCPRRDDGSIDESVLIKILAPMKVVDVEAEQLRWAKDQISKRTKINATPPNGQLWLPGINDGYPYEPERLIRDDDGNIIEQSKAPVNFKVADAKRAQKHAEETAYHASVKFREMTEHMVWANERLRQGRRENLTFDDFVKESGIWRADEGDD
jgi:hypothetical protein